MWHARGWKVDLDHAELVIRVEIVPGAAFCYMGRESGVGGLPTGTGGRLVGLLSGGIDSPVAAWRMMKRGCNVTLVHFHSAPFLSNTSQEKARRLAEVLTRYQLRIETVSRSVRRAAAADHIERAGRSACDHLSTIDDPHCATDRESRAGATPS